MMDDTSPFQDHSGYGRNAVSAGGTPAKHTALVSGATFSQVFSASNTGVFTVPVFHQGQEDHSFSLEAWARVLPADATAAEQQILGNNNQLDGLTVNGTKVTLSVKFSTAPVARVTYDMQQGQRFHAVGVKNKDKISLYVNGLLRSELTLTAEQQNDTYATTNTNLYCGATSGTQKIAVNGLGVYAHALDQEAVTRHYKSGTSLPSADDVVSGFFGERIPLSLSTASLFLDQWWTTEEDWRAAQLFNVAVVDGQLRPQFEGDTSITGQWLDSFALDAAEGTSVQGVSMNWDGEGALIEASVDGDTWATAKRGVNLSVVPSGFNPTNRELQIRVSFPGGIVDDTSFLDNLNVVGIKSSTAPAVAGRTVTYSNAYPEREYEPLQLHDNWGAEIGTGGSISVSADTNESVPARTVEMWIKRIGSAVPSFNIAVSSVYQDGVSNTNNLPIGHWTLVHFVANANITGSFTISGAAQVGHIGVYDSVLSATDVAAIYASYTDSQPLKVVNGVGISVGESVIPVKIYAHDWTIESAG